MRNGRIGTAAVVFAAGLVLSACQVKYVDRRPGEFDTWVDDAKVAQRLDRFARSLDYVSAHLDEWGTLSISAPAVATKGDDFKFDLGLTDKELYDGNKNLEAKSSQSSAFALLAGLSVKSSASVTGMMGSPAVADATATPTPAAAVTPADAADREKKQTNADAPRDNTAIGKAEAAQGLSLAADALARDPRAVLRASASDRFELGMHKFLSKLGVDCLPEGSKLVFMPFTVTCQPGWRTKVGFTGVIDASATFEFQGETIEDESGNAVGPQVVAVYPAIDSQEMDLRMSREELIAMSFALQVLGNTSGARAFADMANKYKEQAESLTSLTRMVGYSNGGQRFGFEFMPDFRALQDPTRKRSTSGYQLEATSFPAVAIVLVQKDLFSARVEKALQEAVPDFVVRVAGQIQTLDTASPGMLRADDEVVQKASVKAAVDQAAQYAAWSNELPREERLALSHASGRIAEILEGLIPTLVRTSDRTALVELLVGALKPVVPDEELRLKLAARLAADIGAIHSSASVKIRFHYSHLWRPHGRVRTSWFSPARGSDGSGRMLMRDWVHAATQLEAAVNQLNKINVPDDAPKGGKFVEVLREKWHSLNGRFENHDPVITLGNLFAELPKPPVLVQIASVFPQGGKPGQSNVFYIEGNGFDKDKMPELRIAGGGKTWLVDPRNVTLIGKTAIKVTVEPSLDEVAMPPARSAVTGKSLQFQAYIDKKLHATSSAFSIAPDDPSTAVLSADQNEQGVTKLTLPVGLLNGSLVRGGQAGVLSVEELVKIIEALRDAPVCCEEEDKEGDASSEVQMKLELDASQSGGPAPAPRP